MGNIISKSIEYKELLQGEEYLIKAIIVSAPAEVIRNIDTEENRGYIFQISVIAQPALPKECFDPSKNLIFIIGNGGDNQIGYIEKEVFIEIINNEFISGLEVSVLEVLMIEGDTGHFKS